MTREAFERLCFGDYVVRAPKPVPWGCAPVVRMSREQLRETFSEPPGRRTHFIADEAGGYDRGFSYASSDDAEHFEFGFGAVQRGDELLLTRDEAVYRALNATMRTSAIYGGSSVTVARVDADRGVITVSH